MPTHRCDLTGKADGDLLRAEGFPCRPLDRILRPPLLYFPFQPRFGQLEKTLWLLPGLASFFPPGGMRPRKAAITMLPSAQLWSKQRRRSLRDGSVFLGSESRSASATLCVQATLVRIPRQDIGSVVYQSRHVRLAENCCSISDSAAFLSVEVCDKGVRLYSLGLPTKVDLHVCGVTLTDKCAGTDASRRGLNTALPLASCDLALLRPSSVISFPQWD